MCQKYKKYKQKQSTSQKLTKVQEKDMNERVNKESHKKQKESGENKSQMSNTKKKRSTEFTYTQKRCVQVQVAHMSETRCQNERT